MDLFSLPIISCLSTIFPLLSETLLLASWRFWHHLRSFATLANIKAVGKIAKFDFLVRNKPILRVWRWDYKEHSGKQSNSESPALRFNCVRWKEPASKTAMKRLHFNFCRLLLMIYIEGLSRILACCKIKLYMQTPWYKRCYNCLPL